MDTPNSVMFVLNLVLDLVVVVSLMDYYWGTKPQVQELWGRRVLGDDTFVRNSRSLPKPADPMLPLLRPVVVVKPPEPVKAIGYDNPNWPLIEVRNGTPTIIRGKNWKQKRNERIREELELKAKAATVANAAQISASLSQKEKENETADTKPPWED